MSYDYDLVILGGGPGGLSAAKRAAKYGATVAIVEHAEWGGTCVNRGCIPKKLLVYAADFAHWLEDAAGYGWTVEQRQFSWQRLVAAVDQHLQQIHHSQETTLSKAGVERVQGHAKFVDAHTVQVDDRALTADKILIAVGGKSIKPDIPGIEFALTSDAMFHLPQLPKKIAILGGGYIGVEFASILNAFGVDVTLMNREHCILTGFDQDVQQAVRDGLTKRGIRSLCSTTAKQIEQVPDGFRLTLSGDVSETLVADTVLCAIGRTPALDDLCLEQAGVEVNDRAIVVDDFSRTSQANIFAVGDCTNRVQLTTVARSEGKAFAETIFGHQPCRVDYDHVPTAVCCRPEAAAIGMTEESARDRLGDDAVQCYRSEFVPLFDRLGDSKQPMLQKLVVERGSDRVLGLHLVGRHAAEIIQGFALAIKQGVTKQDLDSAIGIHPSSAEELFTL